jgi:hypothetical protein
VFVGFRVGVLWVGYARETLFFPGTKKHKAQGKRRKRGRRRDAWCQKKSARTVEVWVALGANGVLLPVTLTRPTTEPGLANKQAGKQASKQPSKQASKQASNNNI